MIYYDNPRILLNIYEIVDFSLAIEQLFVMFDIGTGVNSVATLSHCKPTTEMDVIMEPDRYQQNKLCYIIGMCCLIVSLILFGISLFLFPYMVFGLSNISHPVFNSIVDFFQTTYSLSLRAASWIVFLGGFVSGVVLAFGAFVASNRIDNELYRFEAQDTVEPVPVKKNEAESKDTLRFTLTILFIILLVFLAAKLFQAAISIT
jgi:hypothetical protein